MLNRRKVLLWRIEFDVVFSTLAVSYNRPKFFANASWCSRATTFVNQSIIGITPYGIFVDQNDTVYVPSFSSGDVIVISGQSGEIIRRIAMNLNRSLSLFVTVAGEIYVENGAQGRVEMWTLTSIVRVKAINVNGTCAGLFLDLNHSIYCSLRDFHQVIRSSKNNPGRSVIVAGTGSPGSTAEYLKSPLGIFVDKDFTLYVADCNNDRVQRFFLGETNGTTVADCKASKPFPLKCPTGVVLDADGYLFIVDNGNGRIVRFSINGFQCVIGCSQNWGSMSGEFNDLRRMSFDSWENIFVTDTGNHRVQKFFLKTSSCGKWK